jgi:murein DD-endopeptidase MepM/ murein hydrolase activator NlpD
MLVVASSAVPLVPVAVTAVPVAVTAAVPAGRDAGCLVPPTTASIADPFRPPPCPWCPGNRGLEFATRDGDEIVAMAAGTVTFAGMVAGVLYVTVEHHPAHQGSTSGHAPGLRSTYGRLGEALVRRGDRVTAGQVLARAGGPTIVTLRRTGPEPGIPGVPGAPGVPGGPGVDGVDDLVYIDPAPLIGRPTWRPRLVPLDGTGANPPVPGRDTCAGGRAPRNRHERR